MRRQVDLEDELSTFLIPEDVMQVEQLFELRTTGDGDCPPVADFDPTPAVDRWFARDKSKGEILSILEARYLLISSQISFGVVCH